MAGANSAHVEARSVELWQTEGRRSGRGFATSGSRAFTGSREIAYVLAVTHAARRGGSGSVEGGTRVNANAFGCGR